MAFKLASAFIQKLNLHGIGKLKRGNPQLFLPLRWTELRRAEAKQRTLVVNVDFLR